MPNAHPPVHIAILAKAPVPGLAKTRLIPALGAAGAARLQRLFTRRTLALAQAASVGPVTLWCAPDPAHRFFRALARQGDLDARAQCGGDLGARLARAVDAAAGPVLLLGTDCPALTPDDLRDAARALNDGHDLALWPAEDGGYVMLGLRRPCAALFTDMPWSTDQVGRLTEDRARAAGLRLHRGRTLWDVDLPQDLPRWRALWQAQPGQPARAPAP